MIMKLCAPLALCSKPSRKVSSACSGSKAYSVQVVPTKAVRGLRYRPHQRCNGQASIRRRSAGFMVVSKSKRVENAGTPSASGQIRKPIGGCARKCLIRPGGSIRLWISCLACVSRHAWHPQRGHGYATRLTISTPQVPPKAKELDIT